MDEEGKRGEIKGEVKNGRWGGEGWDSIWRGVVCFTGEDQDGDNKKRDSMQVDICDWNAHRNACHAQ